MFYSEEDSCKCNWQQVSFSSISAQPISEGTKVLRRRGAQGLWAHGNTWEGYSQAAMFIVVAGEGYTHFATQRSPLPLPSTDYSNELRGDLYACLWSSMFLWTLSEFSFLCCLFSGYSACLSVEGADSWLCDHYCNSGTQNTEKKKSTTLNPKTTAPLKEECIFPTGRDLSSQAGLTKATICGWRSWENLKDTQAVRFS